MSPLLHNSSKLLFITFDGSGRANRFTSAAIDASVRYYVFIFAFLNSTSWAIGFASAAFYAFVTNRMHNVTSKYKIVREASLLLVFPIITRNQRIVNE
jgi:hypothetical protein